jgi:hypothetical protein
MKCRFFPLIQTHVWVRFSTRTLPDTDETDLWCLCGKLAMNSGRFNTEGKLAQYQFRESLDMKPLTRFQGPSQAYRYVE